MVGFVVAVLVGVLCIGIGISNMRGNISTLHSYHRHRVSEEDRIPFGKRVGLGTIIIGGGISAFGVLESLSLLTERQWFMMVGCVLLIVALIIGLGLTFYAMIKYNKGIF